MEKGERDGRCFIDFFDQTVLGRMLLSLLLLIVFKFNLKNYLFPQKMWKLEKLLPFFF